MLAQEFRVTQVVLDAGGRPRVTVPGSTNSYYILRRGDEPHEIRLPVNIVLGTEGAVSLMDSRRHRDATFLRVQRVPVDSPLDTDGDGIDDHYELLHPAFLNPLDPADDLRLLSQIRPPRRRHPSGQRGIHRALNGAHRRADGRAGLGVRP